MIGRRAASDARARGPALALASLALLACNARRGDLEPTPAPAAESAADDGSSATPELAEAQVDPPSSAPTIPAGDGASTYPRPAEWPDELPWVATLRPDYARVERSPTGDIRLDASLESAPLAALARPWREGLAARGLVEGPGCAIDEASASFTCTLRSERRLALLSITPATVGSTHARLTLHLLPNDHRPLAALPGPCVTPPTRGRSIRVESSGIDQEGEFYRSERTWGLATGPAFDLDGDGVAEVTAPHPSEGRCPWEVPHDVYVMRGACGHRVGTIVGHLASETALAPFVAGLREVTTAARWADFSPGPTGADDPPSKAPRDADAPGMIPTHHERRRVYRFDGVELRRVGDHDQPGRCHHCGVSACFPG